MAAISLALVTRVGASSSAPNRRAHHSPPSTAFPLPSPLCGSDQGDFVNQSLDGKYTACFRVPNGESSAVVVSLQANVYDASDEVSPPMTTTTTEPPSHAHVSITLSRSSVKPGGMAVVSGRLSAPPSQKPAFATLCWDGCGGMQENGVAVTWKTSTSFQMKFKAPETAWLEVTRHRVSIHPLTSGEYELGVQCLSSLFGCAERSAEAEASIHLDAPRAVRCESRERCATMTLSATSATIGEEVLVKGWAPVQSIFATPESFSLWVSPATPAEKFPAFSYTPLANVAAFKIVLTPREVRVAPGITWADLGRVSVISSSLSGPSTISPESGSSLIAWCQPSSIVVTGGASDVEVATSGVRKALEGSLLHVVGPASVAPQCSEVQLDPRFHRTVYAGFEAGQGNSIPPVYLAPLYTANDGATWHTVPIPRGMTIEDFGGFTSDGDRIEALFSSPNSYSNREAPFGTVNGLEITEATANGGATWVQSSLGCPASGPCVSFGSFEWGGCNMSYDFQSVLLGPSDAHRASGVKWMNSDWVTTVNSCYSQQLVVSSDRELFFVDPSSQYPLLRSTDGGLTWAYVALPVNTSPADHLVALSPFDSLVLASDGAMFNSVVDNTDSTATLFRLNPMASSWCAVPHVFATAPASSFSLSALHVRGSDLIWSQTIAKGGAAITSTHVRSLSSLNC